MALEEAFYKKPKKTIKKSRIKLINSEKELKDTNIINMSKNPPYDKMGNEVLEANKETNNTSTELVNTSGECEEPAKTGGGMQDPDKTEDNRHWTAYMAHIPHSEFDYLKTEMDKLEAPYIMSAEAGRYEHFHFLAKITKKQYHNFAAKNFVRKYQLRAKWKKHSSGNLPRQYGKVNEIADLSKMMTYTMKDKNYTTNMEKEEIEKIIKMKMEDVKNTKNEMDNEIKEKMIKYVNERLIYYITNIRNIDSKKIIRMSIIDFMITRKATIIKTTIERYYYYYVAHTDNELFRVNAKAIYDELYEI